jgi:hypothetical protein
MAVFDNAVDKIFGAAVLTLVTAVVRGVWITVGRLRLGVDGIYVTRTTGTAWLGQRDPDDSAPIRRILVVKQFGWDLHGKESGKGENAEWALQARLTSDGFIQGQYTQRKPLTGISRGAFYLEQDRREPARFRGLWTGWNVKTRDIASGTYEWMQVRRTAWWFAALPWIWPSASQADQAAIAALEAQGEVE